MRKNHWELKHQSLKHQAHEEGRPKPDVRVDLTGTLLFGGADHWYAGQRTILDRG